MEINYSKQSEKFLKKQTREIRDRIRNAIHNLPAGDVKKLQGREGYRLRIGDYRVIFDRNGNIIYIERINNRGQVYKEV
ncbi:type II toxin-antitoxin system RelE family toxin [Parablautia intestinalis]|uniref:type II toxin-antitoxin system RelE family toxin n=1 Tax=Parablautia intestinalis TaxID=2320100 RepID=UPI00256F52B1|nr:type II toxin-antitoxin system RelE/ParE family toxin [Parablautia intestinalis]